MAVPQQPVQRALVSDQHLMGRAAVGQEAIIVVATRTVALDSGQQVIFFLLGSVPFDLSQLSTFSTLHGGFADRIYTVYTLATQAS